MERVLKCPQCNAPLQAHRFARSAVCSFCGTTVWLDEKSISATRFHEAFRTWNSPASYATSSVISIGDAHWSVDGFLASGEISDVFTGRRARLPTERVILKLLRRGEDAGLFNNEWASLGSLHRSNARGADTFTSLLPQLVMHGEVNTGQYAGRRVSIFRWESGFKHTFQDVIKAFPDGIPPRASIWVWRRILEILSFIHASGMAHGAVLPPNLLVQENEHGVRLVGYSRAGKTGRQLGNVPQGFEPFYDLSGRRAKAISPQLDIVMSARCIAMLLGSDAEAASLPRAVPEPLSRIVQRVARTEPDRAGNGDAWAIREELGVIAGQVFGLPQFMPIVMPS